MCGIAGIAGLTDRTETATRIALMNHSLRHRGPDAAGTYVDDGIGFGHLRLSIIDLSEAANQPFADSSGRYRLVFNGEIYNFEEVKAKLTGYPFRTSSDTETVLAAFQRFGSPSLELLNGMFAFAVWDRERRELFVARDRLGVKPFYYYLSEDGRFVFASEIRAILNSGLVPRKVSRDGLADYVMHQSVYSPETIVDGVHQLPAATFGVFKDGRFTVSKYWDITDPAEFKVVNDAGEAKSNIRRLLQESIERRMISDVRLGAFLSGGIDSTAVVALMSEVSTAPVDTFSVGFKEPEFDESKFSRLVAKRYNTRHQRIELNADDFLDALPAALGSIDSPTGDGINTYVVSKAVKESGLKVALSGLGGDELFAGYPNFLNWLRIKNGMLPKIPGFVRRTAAFAASFSPNSRHQRMGDIARAETVDISTIYPVFRQVMSRQMVSEMLDRRDVPVSIERTLKSKIEKIEKFPLLSQFTIAELLGYTADVLLKDTDQFSMACALEVREPFFDYKLVEYVLQISDDVKYPHFPKSLLVEALSPLIPDEVVHRPKMGFVLPFDRWMKNELRQFCSERIDELAGRQLLDARLLKTKWKDFLTGSNGVLWSHLWHLVVLTEWLRNNKF